LQRIITDSPKYDDAPDGQVRLVYEAVYGLLFYLQAPALLSLLVVLLVTAM
jgi:hypothetical protein